MTYRISPARCIQGDLRLPGDKSISHRYAMLGAIARGVTRIRNYSSGADCHSTLDVIRSLGVRVETGDEVVIYGQGPGGLRAPAGDLDCGNSGSTMRMMSGILAAQPFRCRLVGDESLSRRPMARIIDPLTRMGARIAARDGRLPPLEIEGGQLAAIDYTLPVASAQVKSCTLLAGLYARGETVVREPVASRDHTEIALREFGAAIHQSGNAVAVQGGAALRAQTLSVPSDISSAAFFIVAALLVPGSELLVRGVGLNPTRAGLLDFLAAMGASIEVRDARREHGEPLGDIFVRHSPVRGGVLAGGLAAQLIDEIPVLAVLGAASTGGLQVRDAAELRVKETDRIATVAQNLRRMGIEVEERPDGLTVPGGQRFAAAVLDSHGDHRIAMAFAIAALAATGECAIENAEAASVSFPEFYETLASIAR